MGFHDRLRGHRKRSEWHEDDDLVFPATNGEPLRHENVRRRVLVPTAEEAGLDGVGFHTFRHTFATRLFAAGRNAVQVQRLLGHASAAFTLSVYVHLLDGDLGGPLEWTRSDTSVIQSDPEKDLLAPKGEAAIPQFH